MIFLLILPWASQYGGYRGLLSRRWNTNSGTKKRGTLAKSSSSKVRPESDGQQPAVTLNPDQMQLPLDGRSSEARHRWIGRLTSQSKMVVQQDPSRILEEEPINLAKHPATAASLGSSNRAVLSRRIRKHPKTNTDGVVG